MTLSAAEVERGWVEHACDRHGFLVATTPRAIVNCRCGKVARILRHGRIVNETTLKPTAAKARSLNAAGHPFIHGCGDCGADFGGRTLLKRHRAGTKLHKRCLTPEEMGGKGWRLNVKGRWAQPAPEHLAARDTHTEKRAILGAISPSQGLGGIAGHPDPERAL